MFWSTEKTPSIDEQREPSATNRLSREVFLLANKAFKVSINIYLPEPVCPVKAVNPFSKSISVFPNRAIFWKRRLFNINQSNQKDANWE